MMSDQEGSLEACEAYDTLSKNGRVLMSKDSINIRKLKKTEIMKKDNAHVEIDTPTQCSWI